MTAFAGMVDRVDQVTGKLVAYLKEKGVYENTLIMLCADNGACPFDRTRGKEFEPWDSRSYWCYDTGWSHVGNVPFRLHKQNQHEGGISSPMIAHWPAGLKTANGSITDQPAHLIDFMATAIDLGGTEYPDSWPMIEELEPLQGKSLVPIFNNKQRVEHEELYFHYGSNRAIRKGKWKLVSHKGAWELYDIDADGTEMFDLAGQHPELVKTLEKRWHELAKQDRLSDKQAGPVPSTKAPRLKKSGTPESNKSAAKTESGKKKKK
jgi:arylsulfatase